MHGKNLLAILLVALSFFVSEYRFDAAGQETLSKPPDINMGIRTDNIRYVVGTPVRVSGNIYNATTGGLYLGSAPVSISLIHTSRPSILGLQQEEVLNRNAESRVKVVTPSVMGSFSTLITPPPEPGRYTVMGDVDLRVLTSTPTSTSIEVQELFYTRPFFILFMGGAIGFVGLTIVITRAPIDPRQPIEPDQLKRRRRFSRTSYELLRFVFLTTIAVTPITALALTDVQIAPVSPLGIITKSGNVTGSPSSAGFTDQITGSTSTSAFTDQWLINIGGLATTNYNEGIQIPINVVIFGIAGGN